MVYLDMILGLVAELYGLYLYPAIWNNFLRECYDQPFGLGVA
jgi:hypothetical protein